MIDISWRLTTASCASVSGCSGSDIVDMRSNISCSSMGSSSSSALEDGSSLVVSSISSSGDGLKLSDDDESDSSSDDISSASGKLGSESDVISEMSFVFLNSMEDSSSVFNLVGRLFTSMIVGFAFIGSLIF